MVDLALSLGFFSYLIFGLGLVGWFDKLNIIGFVFFLWFVILGIKKNILKIILNFGRELKKDKVALFLFGLLLLQAGVNLIGALGPELGFDALWYHLTLPKIYLEQNRIFYLQGGLFYYNLMPKITEMLYLLALAFSKTGILAKLFHFSFGLLCSGAIYNLGRKFLNQRQSLLAVLLFYSSLVIGWLSITAYIDLARTFFEIMALKLFFEWLEKKEIKILTESAILLGLAIATKLFAFVSLPIFLVIIFLKSRKVAYVLYFTFFSLLIPLPWFIFSFIATGNPIFPIFSSVLSASHQISFNPLLYLRNFWLAFYNSPDPISPVYLIFLPLIFFLIWKKRGVKDEKIKILFVYSIITTLIVSYWQVERYLLPYLSALSLLTIALIKERFYKKSLVMLVAFIAIINIGYRFLANLKFLPVIFGKEAAEQFLSQSLNYSFGDVYDVDGEMGKIIKKDDLVLVLGGHNLFYLNFPFVHESYVHPGTYFSYLLVHNEPLPANLHNLKLIYNNEKTKNKLYLYGQKWPQEQFVYSSEKY
ncbi:MAG: glycosyltransferase family 39 protein [Patescibacteria group bacterium]|nr:glycosyltransferase family 39 protein [Patescibacteria group bacterium]